MKLALLLCLHCTLAAALHNSCEENSPEDTSLLQSRVKLTGNQARATDVFIMLPLDLMNMDGSLKNASQLESWLQKLKTADVAGVMADCWWGITEPEPQNYVFDGYKDLVALVKKFNLRMQFVTSFHMCGNPGSPEQSTYIPLPSWLESEEGIWFTDAQGFKTKAFISIWADRVKIKGRTPLQMYEDWMVAFNEAFKDDMGETINEMQIGLGTDGELKFPSYQNGPADDPWNFPGIGEFQCYDDHALKSLAKAADRQNHPEAWGQPPTPLETGTYNSMWNETSFFTHGYKEDQNQFFLEWYSSSLREHADSMLAIARSTFGSKVELAAKVAGVHWMYKTPSHAAEVTAGYYNANDKTPYEDFALVFLKHDVVFDFTCMEMTDATQPANAFSGPQELVQQVFTATAKVGIPLAGENALGFYDVAGYNQILTLKPHLKALTYLRLSDDLVKPENFARLKEFVTAMQALGPSTPYSLVDPMA